TKRLSFCLLAMGESIGHVGRYCKQNQTKRLSFCSEALEHYLMVYNHHIPQKALGHKTPVQALKEWQEKAPELFNKSINDQAELDKYLPTGFIIRMLP
ncbi:MAG: hypothetical protein H7842_15585, partial [Gammaproteobacteria bacterium SHHR-1]